MKIICHRANLNGSESWLENKPEQIDRCINLGYDVEVDVRYDPLTQVFWLGHDEPKFKISWKWMANRHRHLWIHCKDITTLYEFTKYSHAGYQYFWHQEDDFALTSNNYIWTYPGKPYTPNTIMVMPETFMSLDKLKNLKTYNCYGVCTDYPSELI